jgi:hypothetical protein
MTLSEIKTEDGVGLESGGTYYELFNHGLGHFSVRPMRIQVAQKHGVFAFCEMDKMGNDYPVVNGRAVGLWADRTTLESGLGRGQQ